MLRFKYIVLLITYKLLMIHFKSFYCSHFIEFSIFGYTNNSIFLKVEPLFQNFAHVM